MEDFQISFKKALTEEEYIKIQKPEFQKSIKNKYRSIVFLCIGILLLFSKYTIGIGILVITLIILFWSTTFLFNINYKRSYKRTKWLSEELEYGVNQSHFWVIGSSFNAKIEWKNLSVWEVKKGWLILKPDFFPIISFPIKLLKENNVYPQIIELCKLHGVEFG